MLTGILISESVRRIKKSMNDYVITFFAHFGAMKALKSCREQNIEAKLMPVPRAVSSSCGTCISLCADDDFVMKFSSDEFRDDVELILRCVGEKYEEVWNNI